MYLDHVKLFAQTSMQAISLLKPHVLIVANCDADLPDVADDQRDLLKQLSIVTCEIQTLEIHSAQLDAKVLDHFATADSLELAWVFRGQLAPQNARLIAARPNIVTLLLNCDGIPMESVAVLRDAGNVTTVYYKDDWQPRTIAALQREWREVEWLPLSAR